jgi:hypothetical protein
MDGLSDAASEQSTQTRTGRKRHKRSPIKGKRQQRSSPLTLQQKRSSPLTLKQKRSSPLTLEKRTKKLKPSPRNVTKTQHMVYTKEIIESKWSDETEYGLAFRRMTKVEQQVEVQRLNKGIDKGMKSVIKTKVLENNYTKLVQEKLQAHLMDSRSSQHNMFHKPVATNLCVIKDINFISVGEWVEVDADRTPGFNSEGGIAVIINVDNSLADVK